MRLAHRRAGNGELLTSWELNNSPAYVRPAVSASPIDHHRVRPVSPAYANRCSLHIAWDRKKMASERCSRCAAESMRRCREATFFTRIILYLLLEFDSSSKSLINNYFILNTLIPEFINLSIYNFSLTQGLLFL